MRKEGRAMKVREYLEAVEGLTEPDHLDWCESCGEVTTDLDAGFCPSLQEMGCGCGGAWTRITIAQAQRLDG
jgi:hypothetical protein